MRTFVRVIPGGGGVPAPGAALRLGFERRAVSRQRVRLEDGTEAGLVLPRGTVLRDGDVLLAEDGSPALVLASLEELSEARCPDAPSLARLAYHLGNRHAAVMIEGLAVRYQRDPVLDRMVRGLGHAVRHVESAFEPESGAYEFTVTDAMISLRSLPPDIRLAAGPGAQDKDGAP